MKKLSKELILKLITKDMEEYPTSCAGSNQEAFSKYEQSKDNFKSEIFIKYLSKFGGGNIGSMKIYGVSKLYPKSYNLFEATEKYAPIIKDFCKVQEDFIVISSDGSGNPYFMKPDGSIWWAEWDCGTGKLEKVADTFEDFVWNECYDEELKRELLGDEYPENNVNNEE